jgi:hypothetical protein
MKKRKERIDLGKFGSDWQGCFLLLEPLTVNEVVELSKTTGEMSENEGEEVNAEKTMKFMTDLIAQKFRGGQVIDEETDKKRDAVVEDLDSLAVQDIKAILNILMGLQPSEK